MRKALFISSLLGSAALCGCVPAASEPGPAFVVSGTMTLNGDCPTYVGDNGDSYHLYQSPLLDSATFDRVTATGAVSRLVLARRYDLKRACGTGTVVEVEQVLAVSP